MIELQRHIEVLLLENDCVIVPDFGGFITHLKPAYYDKRDKSFVPPLRTLGFNPQLKMNDSVLVQSYIEAYDLSYPEALRRIESEVAELTDILENEGSYTLDDLGTLTINQEGKYQFEPCEAGILSPSLYGLGTFAFKQLKDEAIASTTEKPAAIKAIAAPADKDTETPELLDFIDSDSDNNDKTLHIKLSWVRNAVAVAAAIVAFFLLATPVANGDLETKSMSNLQNTILYKLIPQDTNFVPTVTPVDNRIVEERLKAEEKAEAIKETTSKEPVYCIVLASQVKKNNAEQFVERLHEQGYSDARVFIYNKVVRVVCGEYDSQEEAYRQAHKMHSKPDMAEAWVYKMPSEI